MTKDKSEMERIIRDALESVCQPDELEKEFRSAMASLYP